MQTPESLPFFQRLRTCTCTCPVLRDKTGCVLPDTDSRVLIAKLTWRLARADASRRLEEGVLSVSAHGAPASGLSAGSEPRPSAVNLPPTVVSEAILRVTILAGWKAGRVEAQSLVFCPKQERQKRLGPHPSWARSGRWPHVGLARVISEETETSRTQSSLHLVCTATLTL